MGNIDKKISKKQSTNKDNVLVGRPDNYPIPDVEELLFFIQRNYNSDSIVYKVNRNRDGLININDPIRVYWIKYSENGTIKELNYLQKKLAYGYTSNQISSDLFEFQLVSYPKRFFLAKKKNDNFHVVTNINGKQSSLDSVYIHADEDGVFPDVRFIEIYGKSFEDHESVFEKITL